MKTYKVDLNDLAEGDVLVDRNTNKYKVLGRAGRMVWIQNEGDDESEGYDVSFTINELIGKDYKYYIEEVKEGWLECGVGCWFVDSLGGVSASIWTDDDTDNKRKNFIGIFKTKTEAEARCDLIKNFVKGL